MRRFAAVAIALALPVAASAATSAPPLPTLGSSWSDARHGWAYWLRGYGACDPATVCATGDGGRTWRTVFRGSNYIFDFERTSATAGVALTGRFAAFPFWTADGGRTWFELERPPAEGPLGTDPNAPTFAGRGSFAYLHFSRDALYRVLPWPPPRGLPCNGPSYAGPNTCQTPPGNAGLGYVPVASAPRLGPMRAIPRGVVVLLGHQYPPPVLVHRDGTNAVRPLPPPPVDGLDHFRDALYAAWPSIFFFARERADTDTCCEYVREVLWRSHDGGASWRVEATPARGLRHRRVDARAGLGRRVATPGGWIAAVRTHPPTIAVRRFGRTQVLALPGVSRRCRRFVGTPQVDWPAIYVTAETVRWWTVNGGRSWAVFGRC